MACEHVDKLGADYIGLYCIYGCQEKVAQLGVEDGQLYLARDDAREYLAVVQGKKQRVVKDLGDESEESQLTLTFVGGGSTEVGLPHILLAFQEPQEVLDLD